MSEENVEIVRAAWKALERRDMEALFAFYDRAIVWDQTRAGPSGLASEYHGHGGVRQFFRAWLEPFESYHGHAQQFIDAGQVVVVCARQGGRGKQSGVEVEMASFWQVYRVENGLIVRIDVFNDEQDALRAAGLKE